METDVSMFNLTSVSQKMNNVVLDNSVKVIWANQKSFTTSLTLASSPVWNTVNSSFLGMFTHFRYHSL